MHRILEEGAIVGLDMFMKFTTKKFYSQDHAEHDEDVPQSNEDSKVAQTEQELSDVVT